MLEPLLDVSNLSAGFRNRKGFLKAVDDVSFSVKKGHTLGVIGESGSGKSVTALSLLRMLSQPSGELVSGQVIFEGHDLLKMSLKDMYAVRGSKISMVFQEPMTALNPLHTIGQQLVEVIHLHEKVSEKDAKERSIQMLKKVGISSPEIRFNEYPHEFSGGMKQRVVIAIALICNPTLLIADEPTTALDVTVQAQILTLLQRLKEEMDMSLLLITHDLGVIAQMCDEVIVMYAGQIVETNTVYNLFKDPKHPYTKGLIASNPAINLGRKTKLTTIPGMVPKIQDYPSGCRFQNRCSFRKNICENTIPFEKYDDSLAGVRCVRWKEIR